MNGKILLAVSLLATTFAGCVGPELPVAGNEANDVPEGVAGDAVVIAVLDSGFNPYHMDWAASLMPQHQDDDPTNDLPLNASPEAWLPGFIAPSGGVHPLNLSLTLDPDADVRDLISKDKDALESVRRSSAGDVHLYYIPGTKVVGYMEFSSGGVSTSGSHGARSASVAAGNVYGTCRECVLVFINNAGEAAIEWALAQDWIDVITNSYGYSQVMRDRMYSGSDIQASKAASERGQTVFFSAGNGQANTFTVPNPTLFSSQEGPDWMVTVGAVSPDSKASYLGHGKPADIANIGSSYPSQGGTTVAGEGSFGGTSSATPTTAGTYARALWWARTTFGGESRVQEGGIIARGDPVPCGAAFAECELGDGILTAKELRTRLFHGAKHTDGVVIGISGVTAPLSDPEWIFLTQGHGVYTGRLDGDAQFAEEFARIVDPLVGDMAPLDRPVGETEWMTVDSWCRQSIWDAWLDGYYVDGESTLPGPDPEWPMRTALVESCGELYPPLA